METKNWRGIKCIVIKILLPVCGYVIYIFKRIIANYIIFLLTFLKLVETPIFCMRVSPTPCNPMDCSPPGSSVQGILQVGILEWVAIPSSKGPSHPGIKPWSPASQADSLPFELQGSPIVCNLRVKKLTKQHNFRETISTMKFQCAS